MSITTKQMITEWLASHSYDGLCNDDCGCGLDDLMPCGESLQDCTAAYKTHIKVGLFDDTLDQLLDKNEDGYDLYSEDKPMLNHDGTLKERRSG